MRTLIATVALLLVAPASVWAQNTDQESQGLGYLFIGAGSHQMGPNSGFGGEYIDKSGLGVGAELATAGWNTSANGNLNWIGLGSADLSYHVFRKKMQGYAPLVEGGYTIFFGQDTDTPGGNKTNGFNVGGGVDLFASKHIGARFDVRYNGHGGRILWASFPNLSQFSFVAFRIGVTFR
ncbi:MAG TPA: hypothetical protein VKO18_13965 [Terriglobia bacterium]|nr:hypothetical protein [Terriglobia bacterium]